MFDPNLVQNNFLYQYGESIFLKKAHMLLDAKGPSSSSSSTFALFSFVSFFLFFVFLQIFLHHLLLQTDGFGYFR